MKKINLTLFPVPQKFGMMESPQIDIAQLYGDLKDYFGDNITMNDYRFSYFKKDIDFLSIFNDVNFLLNGIYNDNIELKGKIKEFYDYFNTILKNSDFFIFPISVLEQFRIEYLLPPLLFSYLFKKNNSNNNIFFIGNFSQNYAKVLIEKFNFLDGIIFNGDNLSLKLYLSNNIITNNIICKNIDGNLIYGQNSSFVDINSFAVPNFDNFDLVFYTRKGKLVLPYELSRGCKNNCFFCYYIHKGGIVYKKEISKIIREILYLKNKYNTNLFHFHDAEINFDNEYLEKLCDEIIINKLNIFWSALCIPKNLDIKLLKKLYNAGCRQLRFGIESGSQRLLDIIGKGTNNDETIEILKGCYEVGISTYATFIVDLKQENNDDLKLTLNFIKSNSNYINDIQICSYGELGNFQVKYLKDLNFPKLSCQFSKKKVLFEKFQYNLCIKKSDIVEFIRKY